MQLSRNHFILIGFISLLWSCKKDAINNDASQSLETFPMEKLLLNDLDAFESPTANWQLANGVYADRNQDKFLEVTSGKGILANKPTEEVKGNLFTKLTHEDIDIELEVLMPKSSNSGIYLMSRYEVQLFDSWGVQKVKHSDMGGIYQRWDENRPDEEKGYEGRAPLINAAKAPGLWQHLRIVFKAPRFDENGNKIKNAIFEEVYLNGTLVQKNQELSGPTRGSIHEDEIASAPIMLQGDHGSVAFKNIQFKKYKTDAVTINSLTLSKYASADDTIGVKMGETPEMTMQTDSMSYLQAGQQAKYLLKYDGTIEIPHAGKYIFTTQIDGGAFLILNGDTIINHNYYHTFDEKAISIIQLEAGDMPFSFIYNKPSRPWRRSMALFVEGEQVARQALHAPSSIFDDKPNEPILITVDNEVMTQRSFMMHQDKKRTHVISIGSPSEVHYSYALETGTLLQAWHGDFLDATPMWHARGPSQLAVPLGPELEFHVGPTLAFLPTQSAVWPDSIQADVQYKPMGYSLDANGYPMFSIKVNDVTFSDKVLPIEGLHKLNRELTVKGSTSDTYLKLASGSKIELLPDGAYAIDDKKFYLAMSNSKDGEVIVREVAQTQELLFKPTGDASVINYDIIW